MPSYCIDPNRGSDDFSGVTADTAWRSFAPLRNVCLGPGDRVDILSPGALNTSLIIHGKGTLDAPILVRFAPGRYDLHPDHVEKRCYPITNNNDASDEPKAIGILVENSAHVIISGAGARLVCRCKIMVACIDNSENVIIRGLQVDYHRPTVSEFLVESVSGDSSDILVHPDSSYSVADGAITWLGEGWNYMGGLAQELIPETGQIWRRGYPLKGLRIEELGDGRLRAHGVHTMTAGRVYQVRATRRDTVGLFIRHSSNVTLENLDLYYLHGMGVVAQFSEDLTLDRVRMAPETGRGRTCAVWADCTHFSGCRGKITVRDCVFDGAHDDAINIHGTYLQIQEIISAESIRVRFMQPQTYGFLAFNPGDDVDFVRWDSMAIYGSGVVSGVEMLDPYELRLTLCDPLPPDVRIKDVLENVTWTPEVWVTGCVVRRIPTRGFLLTTRRKVVVEGNTFVRMRENAITIESDTANWFESGCVRDMSIRNNRFDSCGSEAILIAPRNTAPNSTVHQNIRIIGNTFVIPAGGRAVKASGTSHLVLSGNRFELASAADRNELIVTKDCDAIDVSKNSEMKTEINQSRTGREINEHA